MACRAMVCPPLWGWPGDSSSGLAPCPPISSRHLLSCSGAAGRKCPFSTEHDQVYSSVCPLLWPFYLWQVSSEGVSGWPT